MPIARDLMNDGVRVNTIAPGNIVFPGGDWEKRSTGERADAWKIPVDGGQTR